MPLLQEALSSIQQPLAALPVYVRVPVYLVGAVLLSIVVNVVRQWTARRNPEEPPEVFHYIPFIGNAIEFGVQPIKFFEKCQKLHGDCFTWVLFGKRITTCLGPDGHDFIFNGNWKKISTAEAYKHLTTPVFGTEVVYDAHPALFMEQKKFIKSGLTTENFRKFVPLIKEEFKTYFDTHYAAKTGNMDIAQAMAELIILTASRCLFGPEVRGAMHEGIAEVYHDLDQGFSPLNFMIPNLPIEVNRKRDRAQRQMADIFMNIIKKRRETGEEHYDLVQVLMNQTYKDGTPLPDKHIAHMLIATLFGGQHTSTTTSTWAFLQMAYNPDLVKALRQEQIDVVGSLSGELDFDALKDMPLHDSVVREALRLHPPLFQLLRKIMEPVVYEKAGFVIPAGNHVCAAPSVSQVDERYFKNPLKFDPQRWIRKDDPALTFEEESNKNMVDYGFGTISGARSPYLPFGAGRHRCIGEHFAYTQIKTIIALFVRMFDIEAPTGQGFPSNDYTSMVVNPTKPAEIIYTRRQ